MAPRFCINLLIRAGGWEPESLPHMQMCAAWFLGKAV